MVDTESQDADEHLRQELMAFGETVGKITEKNRPILEKKLNHLRARKRMSEKLSQSMLIEKSPPNKTGRGRGKKRTKKEPEDVSSTNSAVHNYDEDVSSSKLVKKTVEEPMAAVVAEPECSKMGTFQGSQPKSVDSKVIPVTNRRKTVLLDSTTVAPGNSVTSAAPVTNIAAESLHVSNGSRESSNNAEVRGQRRGRKTFVPVDESGKVCSEQPSQGNKDSTKKDWPCPKAVNQNETKNQPASDASVKLAEVDRSKAITSATSRIPKYAHPGKSSGDNCNTGLLSDKVQLNCSTTAQSHLLAAEATVGNMASVKSSPVQLSAQIIDSTRGVIAVHVPLRFEYCSSVRSSWKTVWTGTTNTEGRCTLDNLQFGTYRLHVDSESYFQLNKQQCCYPYVEVTFKVDEIDKPAGVQIALSQFGYSTHFVKEM